MIGSVEAIFGVLAIAGIVVVLYGPWQWVWTDRYRMELFAVRAELFDLAANGRMSFSDPAYLKMRASLNASIRFAHRATLSRIIWGFVAVGLFRVPIGTSRLEEAAQLVRDPELMADLEKLLTEARGALIRSMIARSPVLWIIYVADVTIRCVRRRWGSNMDSGSDAPETRVLSGRAFRHLQVSAEVAIRPTRRMELA